MKRIRLRNVILLLFVVFNNSSLYAADESFFNPTGNPVGGGKGYAFIVDMKDTHVIAVVGNKTGFLEALSKAKPGDIVYVHPDFTIDLTGLDSPALIHWIGPSRTFSPVTPVKLFATAAYPVPAPATIAPTPKPDMLPPLREYPYIPVSLKETKPGPRQP
ncbi:MAG: hypothetical protein ACYC9O_04630 [Candidatus Latescibacterota bacterium]